MIMIVACTMWKKLVFIENEFFFFIIMGQLLKLYIKIEGKYNEKDSKILEKSECVLHLRRNT